jgi:alkylation response protein AidB-like acyl-CoA dehydrogenase
MDFRDSQEHLDLRAAVSAVTRPFGGSYFTERAERHEPTAEAWQALAKQGFIGINMPEEYGGGGAGLTELAIVVEQTAAEGCPLLLLLVSSAICGEMIARYGTADQRQRWLPPLADGSAKMAFAITEPDAG